MLDQTTENQSVISAKIDISSLPHAFCLYTSDHLYSVLEQRFKVSSLTTLNSHNSTINRIAQVCLYNHSAYSSFRTLNLA